MPLVIVPFFDLLEHGACHFAPGRAAAIAPRSPSSTRGSRLLRAAPEFPRINRGNQAMTAEGKIRTETHDRIFKIIIDNPAKKNAFSPAMMEQLSDALTELHNNDNYWVGVICAE